MQSIYLTDEHGERFALCFEDWSADAKDAEPARGCWFEQFEGYGHRTKRPFPSTTASTSAGTRGHSTRRDAHHHRFVVMETNNHKRERR
jgi:hypothetical protein